MTNIRLSRFLLGSGLLCLVLAGGAFLVSCHADAGSAREQEVLAPRRGGFQYSTVAETREGPRGDSGDLEGGGKPDLVAGVNQAVDWLDREAPENGGEYIRMAQAAYAFDPVADGRDLDADGRDPVADGRDAVADGRDLVADGRDAVADGRGLDADGRDPVADGRDPGNYEAAIGFAELVRSQVAEGFRHKSGAARDSALRGAGKKLEQVLVKNLFPYWYGTPWDFNGTTQTPGQGEIACGYFVTTLLRDAGVDLQRVKLAQQASSLIIKTLQHGKSGKWYRTSASDFLSKMKGMPKGLYLVGLDIHVGFLHHTDDGIWFVHASYDSPVEVVREKAATSNVFHASGLFVLGKLTVGNDWLVEQWLKGGRIELN